MKKLSKADEQKAMLALETAIQHANDGMTPSDAIVKAAKDAQLEAPMVNRLVEAFNVSKSLHHFKKTAGADRAATFPIAKPEAVMLELFPPEPDTELKEAAAALHPSQVDFVDFLMAKEAEDHMAVELPPMVATPPAAYERDPAFFAKRAIDEHGKLTALHNKATQSARELYYTMLGTFDKAAAYFKQITPTEPFDLVEKRAYATYGPVTKGLMEIIVKTGGLDDRRVGVKRASADELGAQQMMFDVDVEPYNHIGDAVLLAREIGRISKEAAAIADTIDEHAITNIHLLPERDVLLSIERQLEKHAAVECPGGKLRSKGKGRGLGLGKGKGPVGVPVGEQEEDDEKKEAARIYRMIKRDHPTAVGA